MLLEPISNELTPEQAALKVWQRTMDLAAGAGLAGIVLAWHVIGVGFPEFARQPVAMAGLSVGGFFFVGAPLLLRRYPPRARVAAIARSLPRTGRRRISLLAVVGSALLNILAIWHTGPFFFPGAPAAAQSAAPTEWRSYVASEGGFIVVDIPGAPTETSGVIASPAGQLVVHSFNAIGRGGSFACIGQWVDAPSGFSDKKKAYEGALSSELATQGGTLVDKQYVSWLGQNSLQARLRARKTMMLVRYAIVGKRLYAGKVVLSEDAAPAAGSVDSDVNRFYSSWRITN